jgi:hypothetical protein
MSESDGNTYGDRIYFWVDDEGVRCGPRHRTLKAALGYFKNQDSRWIREEGSDRPVNVSYDRSQFPSQKSPKDLRVGEYVERILSDEERAKIDLIQELVRDGFV